MKPVETNGAAAPVAPVPVERWQADRPEACMDLVAEEVPVALEYNGIAHAVMLASPADLEDFAFGFSLSEGIVDGIGDVLDLEVEASEAGIRVALRVAGGCFARLKERRRNLAGRTGCGLCGVESLHQLRRPLAPVAAAAAVQLPALQRALAELAPRQPMQHLTGATHAAAWVTREGRIALAREDVGRHNALDKLIGALARRGAPGGEGAALITSRASYEMVHKAAAAGIGVLAAVSAPTSFAVREAEALGVALVGFLRPGSQVVYTHHARFSR